MKKKETIETNEDLPIPELPEVKAFSRFPRRSVRKSVSKYATSYFYRGNKATVQPSKKIWKKGQQDTTKYVVKFELSPPAKQKVSRLFAAHYPNVKDISEVSAQQRKELIPCGPPVNISFSDKMGKVQQRSVSVHIHPEHIHYDQVLRSYSTPKTNFGVTEKYNPKSTLQKVAEKGSAIITADDISSKEKPIRRDHTNAGIRALTFIQKDLYSDKSIWSRIQKNKDKLRYLVTCEEDFSVKLSSEEFKEVAALLQHPDVLKELDTFLGLNLDQTLTYRITILMLLRAFELCHKQPHHTLTDELLKKDPSREQTTPAPRYINQQQIFYHEAYIDELAAKGYRVKSICEPVMQRNGNELTAIVARLKHTLIITSTETGKALSFEFDYDCRTFSVPKRINGLAELLVEYYRKRGLMDVMDVDYADKEDNNENISPSTADLLAKSSSLFSSPATNSSSSDTSVLEKEAVITEGYNKMVGCC